MTDLSPSALKRRIRIGESMGMCFCWSSASICGDNGWSAWARGVSVWHPASAMAAAQTVSATSKGV